MSPKSLNNPPSGAVSPRSLVTTILLLALAIFWGHSWEAGLKLDGMTYATLARNILLRGEWKTLHLVDSLYPDFYQHPPLAIWLEAIFFKAFGVSDASARVMPFVFILGTFAWVWRFSWKMTRSHWTGFLSCVVLLCTSRYVKFAGDFYLDGPLCFFLLSGVSFFLEATQAQKKSLKALFTMGLGISWAAAFMTKGLVSLGMLGCMGLYCVIEWAFATSEPSPNTRKAALQSFVILAVGSVVGALALLPWLYGFDGIEYLARYWKESVSYRTSSPSLHDQLVPTVHLSKVYFPGWVILGIATYRLARGFRGLKDPALRPWVLFWMNGLIVVAAFSYVGHSIEHYFLPFYVFSAPLVAWVLSDWKWLAQRRVQAAQAIRGVSYALAFVLAILPIKIHGDRAPGLTLALEALHTRCPHESFHQLLIVDPSGQDWFALAVAGWKTRWQPVVIPQAPAELAPGQILIARAAELSGAPRASADAAFLYSPQAEYRVFVRAFDAKSACQPLL